MLSDAVGRQRELGLLIGDELESHVQLIEETDEMVDRTDTRLRNAQKRLNYVGRRVKDNSKWLTPVLDDSGYYLLTNIFMFRIDMHCHCPHNHSLLFNCHFPIVMSCSLRPLYNISNISPLIPLLFCAIIQIYMEIYHP
jgi:hypothetical protein